MKTVVGIDVVVKITVVVLAVTVVVIGAVVVKPGVVVVKHGYMSLVMLPSGPQVAVMQLPRPSVVL